MGKHTNQIIRRVLSTRTYEAGYEVRKEVWIYNNMKTGIMRTAYTMKGDYIGTPEFARALIVKRGIAPEKSNPAHSVCSIGFCEKEQRWYGWSHRAGCGFAIGDMLFEEKYANTAQGHMPFVQCGKKMITTLEEAKQAAKNFAAYIS